MIVHQIYVCIKNVMYLDRYALLFSQIEVRGEDCCPTCHSLHWLLGLLVSDLV
jgi:hypothetical protein